MSSGRARRKTAKVVDYAKEQEFSDDDLFEDEAEKDEVLQQPQPPRSSSRKQQRSTVRRQDSMDTSEDNNYAPVHTEKGYDPSLPPLRERFTFMPEYELDGSPKIDLIVGRRPMEDQKSNLDGEDEANDDGGGPVLEYEYLVKYKGRSYLHLEWKTGADLESMNKSAKTLYRRFLKKIASGQEEDIEDPNFDPSFAEPQKIVDDAEQEITVELTDKELVEWEKKQKLEQDSDSSEDEEEEKKDKDSESPKDASGVTAAAATEEPSDKSEEKSEEKQDDEEEDQDISQLTIDKLRKIINKDGPFYPSFEGCDNPYRDGYITTPPKKPRSSYLLFQAVSRPKIQRKHPDAAPSEIMTMIGDAWRTMSEEEQAPYIQLQREETEQFERERQMMERAQRPSEMWQPLRRCKMVLDRISKDGFANIFLEPVDVDEFSDYEEIVEQPMDLGTIATKLKERKYQAPENFARDVRKVWNNCKIYNQHGSAIWYVADYMSKQFERLYHAWVLEYRERYLRWINPKARPWEHTCRHCDGECGASDDKMVLCDHCDANYGMQCVGLTKLPKGIWHCPDCKPKLSTVKGVRMLSAVSEQAARKRAELGDVPKRTIKQNMFLVKWAGLGYEFCTWETKEDIDDDALIEEYYQLNNTSPDEPDVTEAEVNEVLEKVQHVNVENAGGISCIPELRSQLYAQTRAFQFTKFGLDVPERLGVECGPKMRAREDSSSSTQSSIEHPPEVVECVTDMTYRLSRSPSQALMDLSAGMPPLLTGEYDAVIPVTSKGLMMNVGDIHGSMAFLGYRQFADGSRGPAEIANLIRNNGDKIVAVDGVSTINKSFKDVIHMLRESGKNQYAFMRLLERRYQVCNNELTSIGMTGRYATEVLQKKFACDRQRLVLQRRHQQVEEEFEKEAEESDGSVGERNTSDDDDSEDEGSEGEFEPDSDDEELVRSKKQPSPAAAPNPPSNAEAQAMNGKGPSPAVSPSDEGAKNEKAAVTAEGMSNGIAAEAPELIRPETTHSLAYRLLNEDIGYSSDEGGDEDCAYFLDGVDSTFSTLKEAQQACVGDKKTAKPKGNAQDDDEEERTAPVKKNDFSTLGESGKVCAAVTLTSVEPDAAEFEKFPFPNETQSNKLDGSESQEEVAAESSNEDGRMATRSGGKSEEETTEKTANRSTVKVEQIETTSNKTIRIWASAEDAAATLQISLNEIKQMLKGDYDEELGDEVGGYRWRYALAGAEVTAKSGDKSGSSKKGKDAYLEFRDKLYDHDDPHIYKNGNKLRDYQIDGVNWLASTWYKRHSCILADEMGLGKTVQIVSYIEHLSRVEKIQRPYLVVVPLSTVEHWRREFQGWTDMVCCVYHDRQRIWRDVMREYEWYYADRPHTPDFLKFDALITTYDTLIGDFDIIGQIPWRVAVVDEAHRLRNVKGKLLECMKEISARGTLQYGFQSRILMTGTPLQNNTQELWTLLNFIEPFKFPSLEEFQANFGNMANRDQVEALQRKISPYMLRRVKEDVAKDIPAKEETVIDVELTSIQKQYYRAIFEHNHSFLSMGATRSNAPKLMNIQMELRKCCNHPFLLEGVEQREADKQFRELMESGKLEGVTPEGQQLMLNEHGYIQSSGKMVLLDKLLPKLRQEGHKVLIFSQMVRMLDLMSEYCDFRHFNYERLDGRVRGTERQKAIDRFETQDDSFIFLLSTRAGGVGINLTAADICIIFDSDWNPQNDVQAQARCHRIGQTKDVRIYRLITSRTFEQEMFDRASKKLGLEQAVLGTFGQDNDDDKPTSKEMEQLLKKGAYALLEDENDETGREFCADDIDSILAKRTRTRVVEGAKTASWLNKQGMVVSKSRFAGDSDGAAADVDVDDPLFWQKVMPDFVTPSIMLTKLDELSEQVEGGSGKKKGPGRGRWRQQRAEKEAREKREAALKEKGDQPDEAPAAEDEGRAVDANKEVEGEAKDEDKQEEVENEKPRGNEHKALSRTNVRKVHKFMSDLKSMMDGIFEEAEDDSLPSAEKSACQKLLLTISVKEGLFNEEQRHTAKVMLKRLEGDRRRRCRVVEQPSSASVASPEANSADVPEELLILSDRQRRKRQRRDRLEEDKSERPAKKSRVDEKESGGYLGEDGYLHHSDSEADWSDIGEDIYASRGGKRQGISKKEARRRRAWASDKDAATAAGRPWPSFPRSVVSKVLETVIDEMIKVDTAKGGVFSVPVPRDEFPEYYEQIKQPMDYGTMKAKLTNGEYRSAQAMQKDFVLVMTNCLQFNAADSDIVKEARRQALMRPAVLKDAAMKHNLFLAEDGSVLEVYSDAEGDDEDGEGKGKKRRRRRKKSDEKPGEGEDANEDGMGTEDVRTKLVPCKECQACTRDPCGECVACLDQTVTGAKRIRKKACLLKKCTNMKEVPIRKRRWRKKPASVDGDVAASPDDTGTAVDEENATEAPSTRRKKTRIRINLSGNTPKDGGAKETKKTRKRRGKSSGADEKDEQATSGRRKRKRVASSS